MDMEDPFKEISSIHVESFNWDVPVGRILLDFMNFVDFVKIYPRFGKDFLKNVWNLFLDLEKYIHRFGKNLNDMDRTYLFKFLNIMFSCKNA